MDHMLFNWEDVGLNYFTDNTQDSFMSHANSLNGRISSRDFFD